MLPMTLAARSILLPCVLITVSACSSGGGDSPSSDSGGDTDSTGSDTPTTVGDVRLSSRITDRSNDGSDDRREVFTYDDAGRVIMHTIENLMSGESQVIVFDYATNGALLSKTDGVDTDAYTYENGRLVMATRVANGMLSYRYDDNDRLVGLTGEGFHFDDDCAEVFLVQSAPAPEFEVTYAGDRIVRIDDSVNNDTATVMRDAAGRLQRVVYSGECYEPEPQRDEYTYDAQGRLTGMFIEGTGYRDINVVNNDYVDDRLVEIRIEEIERGSNAISNETVTRTFDDQGQLASALVTVEGADIGLVRYTYEAGSCQRPGSADPSNVLNVESARLQSGRTPALLCGYWFDERDF